MNEFLDRHDKMQRLNRTVAPQPTTKCRCSDNSLIALCALIMIVAAIGMYSMHRTASQALASLQFNGMVCFDCHRKVALTGYFKDAGSKTPETMALAVLSTNSPRLLAAVAKVESDGNPYVRNTGFKKRHHGAFQVNPRHWGKVPRSAVGQARQAERILTELTGDHGIKKALSVYGGDSTDKYQRTILAELARVP